jgi:chromosomal replication initiator protein
MEQVWNAVKEKMQNHLPSHSYRMWIEPMKFLEVRDGALVLSCPNSFSRRRILDHYSDTLETELVRGAGRPLKLQVEVHSPKNGNGNGSASAYKDHHQQLPLPNLSGRPHSGRLLRKNFTFDQFVVGGNNDFAYSASLSLASKKNTQQSALFLLSATGLGKSHLAQAIGHHILTEMPAERVYYITAEDFTNEMVQALRHDSINRFKEKYRTRCDVLLLEDVQFLSGKERTQLELALTLDALADAGKKIIFSSCYAPTEIPKLSEELRSRLSGGLVSNIDPPDFRTRLRILRKKVESSGFPVTEDVMHFLASELTENVRQLESGLIGVAAKGSLLGSRIDVPLAETVVKNIVRRKQAITVSAIKKLVCRHARISEEDLISRSRKQTIVRPRQIAIYLSRKYTDQSLQAIGRSFNRYHATALHAIACVERAMKQDSRMRRYVDFLCQKLEEGKF